MKTDFSKHGVVLAESYEIASWYFNEILSEVSEHIVSKSSTMIKFDEGGSLSILSANSLHHQRKDYAMVGLGTPDDILFNLVLPMVRKSENIFFYVFEGEEYNYDKKQN